MLTSNVQVVINMLKLLYLAELVDINLKYIASNISLMMSLSVGYLQILASGYPDSKLTICFRPKCNIKNFAPQKFENIISQTVYTASINNQASCA